MMWLVVPLILTIIIVAALPPVVGYIVLLERKVLADFQVRYGPMRVGPYGILQGLADPVKLLLKEDTTPAAADKLIFWAAPVFTVVVSMIAFAVLPWSGAIHVIDANVGVLLIAGLGALTTLGLVMGGWASNSHYSLLGAMRSAAQLVSYEVPLSLALLAPIATAGTLSLTGLVRHQAERGVWMAFDHFGLMLLPMMIFFIAATAESNRAPFDLPEAESEIVSGYHVEYSGFRWAMFMLAEYVNMLIVSMMLALVFLGGWLVPFSGVPVLGWMTSYVVPSGLLLMVAAGTVWIARKERGWRRWLLWVIAAPIAIIAIVLLIPPVNGVAVPMFWFALKTLAVIYVFIWFRGTFPRLRYDQLMALSWKRLTPLALVGLVVNLLAEVSLH